MCESYRQAQGLVEYSLIIALVVTVIILALSIFGPALGATYNNIITTI
jgi:Flp pilus assembly pilin Flp